MIASIHIVTTFPNTLLDSTNNVKCADRQFHFVHGKMAYYLKTPVLRTKEKDAAERKTFILWIMMSKPM